MRTIFYLSIFLCAFLIVLGYHPEIIVGEPVAGWQSQNEPSRLDFTAFLGGIVIFAFYFIKFGHWPGPEGAPPGFRPKPMHHFTTWLRYMAWAFVYGLIMLLSYLFILFFPKFFINFLDAYTGLKLAGTDNGLLQEILGSLQGDPGKIVPYAIIVVTFVWSGMFGEWEQAFRRSLQELALIPTEAESLVKGYERNDASFQPDPVLAREVLREIPFRLVSREDLSSMDAKSLAARYWQCEYMLDRMADIAGRRAFAKTMAKYKDDLEEVKIDLNKLRSRLQNYKSELLESMRSFSEADVENARMTLATVQRHWADSHRTKDFERRYFGNMRDQLMTEVQRCRSLLLKISICCVLAIGKSPGQRNVLLKQFGLAPPADAGPIFNREYAARVSLTILATTVLCTGVYFTVPTAETGDPGHWSRYASTTDRPAGTLEDGRCSQHVPDIERPAEILFWSAMATILHLFGVLGGYSVQKWLDEEHKQFSDGSPGTWRWFDLMYCLIFGFCLNVFVYALLLFSMGAFDAMPRVWPWAWVASVTAAFTGVYMSDTLRLNRVRWLYVGVQGLVTGIMSLFVIVVIYEIHPSQLWNVCAELKAFMIYSAATTALLGAALSHILQSWICSGRKTTLPEKADSSEAAG